MCACLEVCEENKTVFNGGVAPKASGGGKSTCHKRVVDSCKVRACLLVFRPDGPRVSPPPRVLRVLQEGFCWKTKGWVAFWSIKIDFDCFGCCRAGRSFSIGILGHTYRGRP